MPQTLGKKLNMPREQDILDAAILIESFVADTCGPYDWDDFLNGSRNDSKLQKIHEECEQVAIDYPARSESEWCSPEGGHALIAIAVRLRAEVARLEQT
jgi:hypothetical protein